MRRDNTFYSMLAKNAARLAGRPAAFNLALMILAAWLVSGPLFGFSDTWQLVINTGTTIVTFLMVFLIQNTQNRDGVALQTKLDELIRASTEAEDAFMGIEKLTDKELEAMHSRCKARAKRHQQVLEKVAAEKDARARRKGVKGGGRTATRRQPTSRRRKAVAASRQAAD